MAALQIVVFYCAEPGKTHVVAGDLTGPEQIDLLYRSARAVNPNVGLTVLTTAETDLSGISFPFVRVNGVVNFDWLMFERTRMQKEYVERQSPKSPLAFLDSDILVCRDIALLFTQDFDVGLTWRVDREMPFNGGVIFVNNKRPQAALRFFDELKKIYYEQQRRRLEWYGDQYALTELVGLVAEQVPETETHESRGVRFRFLPCDLYNFTPPGRAHVLLRGPRDAFIMHFKGVMRRYMALFWKHWLDPRRSRRFRFFGMLLTTIKLAATARAYRHRVNTDQRRFNLDSQDSRSWRECSAIAAEFLSKASAGSHAPLRVLDIGCGDCKLQASLAENGLTVDYRGYDLLPQSADVRALDISVDGIPDEGDAVVSLDVVEYLADADSVLQRFRRGAPWLVISHAAKDLRNARGKTARRLSWRTYMTTAEFERTLKDGGYAIVDRRITPDQKTCVWLARANGR